VNINKVMLAGRAARIFDLKYFTDGTPSMAITLATSDFWNDAAGARQEHSEFHRVVFVGKAADNVQRHLEVGQGIYVCGKLTHRSFGEGEARQYITEVRVDDNDYQFGPKPKAKPSGEASKAVYASRARAGARS
jgi:single-strand DNA-binding protein